MPTLEVRPLLRVESPYPGLRTFEPEEAFLFFGREEHTRELLVRLAGHRFLAVVGTSGSGKSSLVRAGLVPALQRGFLDGATSRWKVAIMRPGSAPIANLAVALGGKGLLPGLNRSSFGILEAVKAAKLESGENLLLVVDQFEEIFRFQRDRREEDGGAEGQLFVASLLEAAAAFSPRVFVVLTMRSEFLGDCTQFPGLPEALNRSQYLIPRLTREQCREAIEKPLLVAGATVAPALVQRLLYELGDDSDQLPVLQHALNRTFQEWKDSGAGGDILIKHYQDAGTLANALNLHAEGLLPKDEASLRWVQRVFRCLTTVVGGREVRNPASLERILAVTGASDEAAQAQVRGVIDRFSDKKDSLLVLSPAGDLKPETVVDISHESLIRRWRTLKGWVGLEVDSVRWYGDVVEDAWRYPAKAQTWRDPKLAYAVSFVRDGWWNEAWAKWVLNDAKVPFGRVRDFLDRGEAEQIQEIRRRKLQRNGLVATLVLALMLAMATAWSYRRAGLVRADLDNVTRSWDDARKKVADFAASLAENAKKQQELEAKLKDSSGLSAEETKRLNDDLAKLKDQGVSVEQQRRDAEAKMKTEADARKQLQDKANVDESALAVALKRADDLDRQLKAANVDSEAATQKAENLDRVLTAARAENDRLRGLVVAPTRIANAATPGSNTEPTPGAGTPPSGYTRVNPEDGLKYVWIPAGKFTMGCSVANKGCYSDSDEVYVHDVTITKGFWIGQTEVTQEAYQKVTGQTNPSKFKGTKLPVESVNWDEAQEYCKAIGGRLPTEAEWEYAARAGNPNRYGDPDSVAWYLGNSGDTTHEVGQKAPNAWGLYDTLGNVAEWTSDWYAEHYPGSDQTDPRGPTSGQSRVTRGASWGHDSALLRAGVRLRFRPDGRASSVGFRCVREVFP
jgi:formylglycine-generating enzyme required for sulfatase activity